MEQRSAPRLIKLPYYLVNLGRRSYKIDNLSETGLGFITSEVSTLVQGSTISITLHFEKTKILTNALIAHVTEIPSRSLGHITLYLVGLKFIGNKGQRLNIIAYVNKFRQIQEIENEQND